MWGNKPGKDEPEWTAENQSRNKGDTTFKQCGWCEHAGCGSYRYQCMLSGSCDLLRTYGDERKWNSPCKVIGLGKKDLQGLIDYKKGDIKDREKAIVDLNKEIGHLTELKKKAGEKPPLPGSRDSDHFNVGDRVAVNMDGKWIGGTVVYGYRHHDGCVSFHLDGENPPKFNKLENAFNKEEKPKDWEFHQQAIDSIGEIADAPGCGYSTPSVMLLKEWEWFADHPEEYEWWIKQCLEKDYNGEKLNPKDYPTPVKGKLGKSSRKKAPSPA